MIEFKPYEAKPITRMAFQITEAMLVTASALYPSTYYVGENEQQEQSIRFKAYERPEIGDWVVRLTEGDTYHCTDAVFRERNIV